jgi:hypothetical protein
MSRLSHYLASIVIVVVLVEGKISENGKLMISRRLETATTQTKPTFVG